MMRRAVILLNTCVACALSWSSVASAQSAYSIRNESISAGGTTGASANFRATTLMAEPTGTGGTSPNFGILVIIPETIEPTPTAIHPSPRLLLAGLF